MDKNQKTVQAYDKNPQFYADKFDSYGIRIDDIDRAIKLNESGSNLVLELGCGNGKDAEYIVSKVGKDNYVGLDASEGLIELARTKVSHVTFKIEDMRKISVTPETYGIIFSFASLLHLKQGEMADLVKKSCQSLKKGGVLYISSRYGPYREKKLMNLGDEKYYYYYKPEDIKEVCEQGFELVYNTIHDGDYGPSFTVALRKI